jgi:hypothetical protein
VHRFYLFWPGLLVGLQIEIVGENDLDPSPFEDLDGRILIQKFREHLLGARSHAFRHADTKAGAGIITVTAVRADLREAADSAKCERRAENLEVMVIDLADDAGLANLVQSAELIE